LSNDASESRLLLALLPLMLSPLELEDVMTSGERAKLWSEEVAFRCVLWDANRDKGSSVPVSFP
jgi:hypothetical protein